MSNAVSKCLSCLLIAGLALAGCGGGGGGSDAGGVPMTPSPPVDGPAWTQFGSTAQHSALSTIAAQDLTTIRWQAPVDLAPPYRPSGALLAHYASPVVTSHNTVLVCTAGTCRPVSSRSEFA